MFTPRSRQAPRRRFAGLIIAANPISSADATTSTAPAVSRIECLEPRPSPRSCCADPRPDPLSARTATPRSQPGIVNGRPLDGGIARSRPARRGDGQTRGRGRELRRSTEERHGESARVVRPGRTPAPGPPFRRLSMTAVDVDAVGWETPRSSFDDKTGGIERASHLAQISVEIGFRSER